MVRKSKRPEEYSRWMVGVGGTDFDNVNKRKLPKKRIFDKGPEESEE